MKPSTETLEAMVRLNYQEDWATVAKYLEAKRIEIMETNCLKEGPAVFRNNGSAHQLKELLDEVRHARESLAAIGAREARTKPGDPT